MADELELLRRANPVPSADPRFREGPLPPGAERHLDLLTRRAAPAPNRPARRPHVPRPRRAHLAWAVVTAAVVAVTALALLLAGPATPSAVAAPRPLTPVAGSAPVSLERLAERARTAAGEDASPRLRQGTHVQSWSLSMTSGPDARRPVTLPEERVVRWRPDGSRTELVVATDPRRPGQPVVTDPGGDPRTVDDGHVLSRVTLPPSWSDAPPWARPPHDARGLRAYLDELDRAGGQDTPRLLDAVAELLDHWTLGGRESAALAQVLADAGGLRPAGGVTDRLGRPGQAYTHSAPGIRRMIVLAPDTGAVLGLETTFTKDQPDLAVKAGDVMAYRAWMR
ncbi:CU044_5270 family protein [Streptomyces fructofermentans]|uniref:2-oxoglutarate dehydrogenase n=1 Tax=Streptomyces fructofermentans TaxID=152141 RepID=A0A918N9C0_9ACTN|nr:CU044_5270 family protein [Streptomyces fructofermentans]GGX55931.1 hypothetical protein GCM10010515_24090 [Streptomyces fructofermentans]